jgi:hypothetical protein
MAFHQQAQAQVTTSFNFSRAPQPVSGWVNVVGDPSTAASPIVATDPVTGYSISSVGSANWVGVNGGASFDGGGADGGTFFPAAVMKNHWFQGSDYYALYDSSKPQFIISGLNTDSVYTLRMTGSFTLNLGVFNLNPCRYTVAGAVVYGFIDVNGANNTANGATFHNIAPDATGKIKVYVNTYGGSNVSSICGLQIIQGYSTGTMPVVSFTNPLNNDVLSKDGYNTLKVNATAADGSIQKVEFYAGTVKLGEVATNPYNFTWLNPTPGKYVLKARAIDGLGNATTASINVTVSAFWSLAGNSGANPDSNFLGTTDSARLAFRTNNVERMSISPVGSVKLNKYKNDSAGSSLLTTDTSGNLLLKKLSFTNGLVRVKDQVQLGGSIDMHQFSLDFKDSTLRGVKGGLAWGSRQVVLHADGYDTAGRWIQGSALNLATNNSFNLVAEQFKGSAYGFANIYGYGGVGPGQASLTLQVTDPSVPAPTLSEIGIYASLIELSSKQVRLTNLPNNATKDSVLTTDTVGNLTLKALSSFGAAGRWQLSGTTIYDSLDNIGIGTSNTQGYKLAVKGNVIVERIKVKAYASWPDYVFDKDYHLPPLATVEKYITRHGHLPGVISAEEAKDKGLDIADNQAVQQKKIEELTLYMIEMNKKIERLDQENKHLKRLVSHMNSRKTK